MWPPFDKRSNGMNDDLRLDPQGEALIKGFEKCSLRAYICPAGKLTIGWGHTNDHGRQFKPGDVWTQAECDEAFAQDIFGFECHVRALVKVPVNQGQFSALVSFAYNCGWGALARSSLLSKLNRGDYAGAGRDFLKWTHGGRPLREFPGLVRRRHAESALFLGADGHHVSFDGLGDCPQHVEKAPAPPAPAAPAVGAGSFVAAAITCISGKVKDLDLSSIAHDPVVILCGLAIATVVGLYVLHWRQHHEAH
jgi:lysozyme